MSAEFELLRFEAAPVSAAVAVVELDGRFDGPAPARVRLLIERGGRGVEVPAVTSGGDGVWTATFAVAVADLADERTEYALAPGRGPLIGLPAPQVAGGAEEDRYVRLARQANDLRHRLGEATEAAAEVEAVRAELAAAERRGEEEADRLRAEIAAAERRAAEEADRLRAEIAAATARAEKAESAVASAHSERDAATRTSEAAQDERDELRENVRETEQQLTETERERASLRARAESADRTVAALSGRTEELEQRAREAEARVVAAEDETRLARRDLRDTRARLESLLREQRHQEPARRGHEVPEDKPAPEAGPGSAAGATPRDAERTDVLETREIPPADEHDGEDHAPPTTATATRTTRLVRITDEEAERTDRAGRHAPDLLDPARVGAGYIEPSQTKPSVFTPARIMVGIALLLLVAALIAIVLGAGLV